jgi:hypothetical protein
MMHEKLGVQPHIVEAVINHKSAAKRGVAGTYNRAEHLGKNGKRWKNTGSYIVGLNSLPRS